MLPTTVNGPTGSCTVPATVPPSLTSSIRVPPPPAWTSPVTMPSSSTVRLRSPDSLRSASVLPPTSTPVSAPVAATVTAPPSV